MIYERAARREFAQAAAATIVVLLAVVLSVQLIRLLKDAALGKLAPEGVLAMLTFAATRYMPMLLTLTLFIAVAARFPCAHGLFRLVLAARWPDLTDENMETAH